MLVLLRKTFTAFLVQGSFHLVHIRGVLAGSFFPPTLLYKIKLERHLLYFMKLNSNH